MEDGLPAERLTRRTPAPKAGVVHLGLGAFFRAHGARYIARAMELSGGDWGIVGVSLKRPDQRDRLAPQGFAYTAVEMAPGGERAEVVEVLADVLVAPEDPGAVLAAMADPGVRLVTLTVTEKGYCHEPATGRLLADHPDILADLADPARPVSAPGFLVRALALRRDAGTPPFAVVCCDNLPDNGPTVRGVVLDLAARICPHLADWIALNVRFPATMVDRIVPATKPEDLDRVATLTGWRDESPVLHEPFGQWVIERFDGPQPDLAAAGAQIVDHVAPFELMKLRCLNGTHSSLAYLGYLAGFETIPDTVADPAFARFVRHLWSDEILPGLTAPPGVSLPDYAQALFARYANPAIRHRTWQIAMDGSQKLPQRILGQLAEGRAAGRPMAGLTLAVAGWMRYVGGVDERGQPIDVRDPMAARLKVLWDGAGTAEQRVAAFLSVREVFPEVLSNDNAFKADLQKSLEVLMAQGAGRAVAACHG